MARHDTNGFEGVCIDLLRRSIFFVVMGLHTAKPSPDRHRGFDPQSN